MLRDHLCLAEGVAEFYSKCSFFFCDQFIDTEGCHSLSDHRRSVWHGTDDFCIFAKALTKPLQSLARRDRNKNLSSLYTAPDLIQNALQKLRLHCQKNNIRKIHHLRVVICLPDAKFLLDLLAGLV